MTHQWWLPSHGHWDRRTVSMLSRSWMDAVGASTSGLHWSRSGEIAASATSLIFPPKWLSCFAPGHRDVDAQVALDGQLQVRV